MNTQSEQTAFDKTNYRFFAFNILKTKGKALFCKDRSMECLAKSDMFFKELLNTLSRLYFSGITPQKFLEVIQTIKTSKTDSERLLLVARLYVIYVEVMEKNGFKIPQCTPSYKLPANTNTPAQIQKRIEYLRDSFVSSTIPALFSDSSKETDDGKNICYLEFSDIQNETLYIINEIKSLVVNGQTQYKDVAVFIDKTEARKKFLDLVKAQNLPVISSIYSEDYENLKNKISVCRKISDLFLELAMKEFSYEEIKNINISSKAQREICFEQLDEIFKNIISETIKTPKTADSLLTKSLNSQKPLIETVFTSWHTLKEDDKNALSAEFNSIKTFYEAYKNKEYALAIESLIKKYLSKFEDKQLKETVTGKIKSLNDLEKLFKKLDNAEPEFDSFEEIMQGLPQDKEKDQNAVHLSSITSDKQNLKEFKYVYIAGLTRNNYPSQNTSYPFISSQTDDLLTEQLKKLSQDFEYFLTTDSIYFEQRLQDFCHVMSLAANKITLSTHTYEAKKQTQPSIFFKVLSDADESNFSKIKDDTQKSDSNPADGINTPEPQPTDCAIITEDDMLKLNPSAINTFQKCPRKYYYKNLLNLKEPYTFSASYGSIVHAVFQVLNTNFRHNYNQKMALALAKVLFNAAEDEQRALQAGFTQTDIELVKACPALSLEEMKENFNEAIEDFSLSGGFDAPPAACECERTFSFKLKEIPNVIFDGRIDAILTTPEGSIKVIDYKTGKNKTNSLDYAISEYGVNFKLKTGKDPASTETLQKAYDYQIPIYYLACQNSAELDEFKNRITSLGLLYIRPKSKENGCAEDFVSAAALEEHKDKIIQNLKETVIDKILNETEFPKTKSWDCDSCAFKFLCEKEED